MSVYRCPDCLAELFDSAEFLRCAQCHRDYPVIDSLPLLSRSRDYYYGEVPRDVMQTILTRAMDVGWQRSLMEHADASGGMAFYNYFASEARAGFKFLLDHFETGVVLDYGCGSGAIALSLARNFSHVYATDLTLERAQFTRIRARQENLSNVTVFCCGDTEHVPLRDSSVDVVILDGVLEWVPETRSGEPRSVQITFLKELGRILKDDGHFFIGIENRVGSSYFRGLREDHTRLRFASLLPRRMADLYSQWLRGKPVRTYTYTRSGYRSLLRSAGFDTVDFWGLLPSYRRMEKAVSLRDSQMFREALNEVTWTKRLRNLLVRPILPWVVDSFGISAGKVRAVPYIEKLTKHVARTYLEGEELNISRYWQTRAGTVQVHASGSKAKYILKLPLYPRAEQRLEAAVRNIQQLEAIEGLSLNELLVSPPIVWARYRGQAFVLERELSGQSLDGLAPKATLEMLLPRACEYLALLCRRTLQPADAWSQILGDKVREYGLALAEHYRLRALPGEGIEDDILQIADYVSKTASPSAGFRCVIHGDFQYGNILVTRHGMRITAVLDWGSCEMQSVPFVDLFNLMTRHGQCRFWGESVVELHQALRAESPGTEPVRIYARQVNVDKDLIPYFLIVYWIRQCLLLIRSDVPQLASVLEEAICQPLVHFRAR